MEQYHGLEKKKSQFSLWLNPKHKLAIINETSQTETLKHILI